MNFPRLASVLLFGSSLASFAANAHAQQTVETSPPVRGEAASTAVAGSPIWLFGGRHELAIASDAGLSIANTSVSGGNGSTTTITLRPAIDYFIIDNLSLGGFIGLDYTHVPTGHSTAFSVGPRVGYNIPIGTLFSVWPKVGFSYSIVNASSNNTSDNTVTSNSFALNLFVPLLVHPAPHFFIGFGPALDVDLTGTLKSTTIAGRLTIGGWL